MKARRPLGAERKVQVGFAVALVCLAVVGIASFLSVAWLNDSAARLQRTHQVIGQLDALFALSTDAHNAHRGFTVTGDENYLEPYRKGLYRAPQELSRLREQTLGNGVRQKSLDELSNLLDEQMALSARVIDARRMQGMAAAAAIVVAGEGKRIHDRIRALINEMKADEEALLQRGTSRNARARLVAQAVIAGGSALAVVVVALALLTLRRDIAARQRAENALLQAKSELESRVQERTADLARANESLLHSERRFRALIEHGSDGILLSRMDGSIAYASPAVLAITGYTPDEMVGRNAVEFRHPDELESRREGLKALLAHPELPRRVLWRHRHKRGGWIWLEGTVSNLLDDPAVGAILTNYRDVSERQEAQARMHAQMARLMLLGQITRAIGERQDLASIYQVVIRTLEEHLPVDFVCVCTREPGSPALTVTRVGLHSEALAMALALTEQARFEVDENGLSHCLRGNLVYEPDIAEVPFPFAQRLARAGLRALVAAPLQVQGQVFGILLSARLRPDSFSSGECEFLRQVSEHVALAAHQAQLYGALQLAYEDLRHTQQAVMQQERLRVIGQMASGIAHDINNAISPVALYAESLLERETHLSERGREYLKHIENAVSDVAGTVDRLRDFYRPRDPGAALADVQLNVLVPKVLELTRARWADMPQQRGVVIHAHTELAPDLPPVNGIEGEIREALVNLVFNAADAMPEGGTLVLRTLRDADGAHVTVQVADSGGGMDDETRRRCLEPFYTTKGERGTGLGLGMVYGTMQRHGGELHVDSEPNAGTTMSLRFNVAPAGSAAAAPPQAAKPARQLSVLVIDDDPLLLKSLRDTLEADGHAVHTANGGQAGIDAFAAAHQRGERIDAVITDLGMPYVDGRQVARSIKQQAPEQPVILLTGWGQRLVADGEAPDHVDEVLSKPPRLGELRGALARHAARE